MDVFLQPLEKRNDAVKKIFIIVIVVVCAYQGWKYFTKPTPPEPLYQTPYIVVYGRDACGITEQMMSDLDRRHVPYAYEIVDQPEVAKVLHNRMERSGVSTESYGLPVVDVSGKILVRPECSEVITLYKSSKK